MKYSEEIVEALCKHLEKGSSIKSACAAVGISEETFHKWKREKSEFSESIGSAMAIPDRKVENALYRTAVGFQYTEIEFKGVQVGEKVKHIPIKKIRKKVLPNVAAQKFILTNRNPKEWKDKQETELSGEVKVKIERVVTDERPQE